MSPQKRIIIVGGGPTGLLLANLLGRRGMAVTVLERNPAPPETVPLRDAGAYEGSRAIGITPPSLEILDKIGLADQFIAAGLPIRRAVVHGATIARERTPLGEMSFQGVHDRFPYILSLPQIETARILEAGARRFPGVEIQYGREVIDYRETGRRSNTQGNAQTDNSEDRNGRDDHAALVVRCQDGSEWHGSYCVAADGAHGTVGRTAGIPKAGSTYKPSFLMGDYTDRTDLGDVAHLWFTREGAVESFPLPGGLRRWIIQETGSNHDDREEPDTALEKTVARRAGFALQHADRIWESGFRPAWSEAETFYRGRLFLAGDAAHTMSPIGGQGMNTGFADGELLAMVLAGLPASSGPQNSPAGPTPPRPADYNRIRRRAARAATRRAALGMTIGTIHGAVPSAFRNALVRLVLLPLFRRPVARHFAMLTIPGRPVPGRFTPELDR